MSSRSIGRGSIAFAFEYGNLGKAADEFDDDLGVAAEFLHAMRPKFQYDELGLAQQARPTLDHEGLGSLGVDLYGQWPFGRVIEAIEWRTRYVYDAPPATFGEVDPMITLIVVGYAKADCSAMFEDRHAMDFYVSVDDVPSNVLA